ncbi:hypothetical protein L249_3487 [Ophiocordyceps polyrhachis-furcata BCC 54312]|uniref:Uncharacterized protein n=1 Tax=Ophiocordyceps polyrhachis-furcata BCC 54312 TaxID=1330021 RepID=A0A367LMM8_9HYPO|nr:hypothetical protein L249_3487 [Ophiocordyceps polyrhachis-furcata BCC 54312]
MGNLCGKQDPRPDPPGRVLGSTTTTSNRSPSAPATSSSSVPAKARAKAKNQGGKLQRQLSAQKRQSRSTVLKQASQQDRRARDADDATSARNWD